MGARLSVACNAWRTAQDKGGLIVGGVSIGLGVVMLLAFLVLVTQPDFYTFLGAGAGFISIPCFIVGIAFLRIDRCVRSLC